MESQTGKGRKYPIQTIAPSEGKWITERNVHIHSTFKRQVADDFNKYNPSPEQFLFEGNVAIPLANFQAVSNFGKSNDRHGEVTSALKSTIIINKGKSTLSKKDKLTSKAINEGSLQKERGIIQEFAMISRWAKGRN